MPKRLTETEKIEIRKLYNEGISIHEIAKKFDRYDSTIQRFLKREGT